jgi:hypothetical protein
MRSLCQSWCSTYILLILEENTDGTTGVSHKASLEAKIKRLEKGLPAFVVGEKKPKTTEKYNSNGKNKGVYDDSAEVQIGKKKKREVDSDDDEEEVVPVKKSKKN